MASNRVVDVVGRRYWREADARVVVGAWQRGGRSLASFAQEHGVEAARVARWAARLRAAEGSVRFHPVRVIGVSRRDGGAEPLEVVLGNGRRVRVPAGFVAEDLQRVLDVLERRTAC